MQGVIFSWQTIPLGTYAAIDALSRAKASDPMQQDVSLLSMLTGKTEEYFMGIPFPELTRLRKEMHDFLSKTPEEKYYPEFECNGRKYKVSESMEEFTGAQLEGISALQLTDENFASKSHYAMAILCKEIPKEVKKKTFVFWETEFITEPTLTIHERAADFEKHLPTSIGMGVVSFFFLFSQTLLPLVLGKVNKEMNQITEQLMDSQKNQPRRSAPRK